MSILIFRNGVAKTGGSYDGEKIPGDLANWNVLSSDSNEILDSTYGLLSQRSATLYHTYPPVRSAINKLTDYAIGAGLMFRSQPDWSIIPGMTKESAKDFGKDFQKIVHHYFQLHSFYIKQPVLFRTSQVLGDSLLFFEHRNTRLSDLIPIGGDTIDWSYTGKNYTLGIKHDAVLRPQGIKKHNDKKTIYFKTRRGNRQLLQFFVPELAQQLRGYPLAYSIINLSKNDDRHHDATVHRAGLEAILLGSYETETSNPIEQTRNMAKANLKTPETPQRQGFLSKVANAFKLGPGNIFTFRKNEKLHFHDLKTPNSNFPSFKEWIIKYVGMGTGIPPEVIIGAFPTSYSAHKGAMNVFKKVFMARRKFFEQLILFPVIAEIAMDAIAQGLIKAPGFFSNPIIRLAYIQGNFLGTMLGAINPLPEARAEEIIVKNAFELRGDIAAQYGNEWDNFIEEYHEQEQEYMRNENTA